MGSGIKGLRCTRLWATQIIEQHLGEGVGYTVDEANAEFWQELCGSNAAQMLGIEDASPESLDRFDSWYSDFYPYLWDFLPERFADGSRVLEVGLGYGTVASYLMRSGAQYFGLDIASAPVQMARYRSELLNQNNEIVQGSILNAPYEAGYFDAIVAIGSLHHTGDLSRALTECHRLLRHGGRLYLMVYNAYSYRRWSTTLPQTAKHLVAERRGLRSPVERVTERQRGAYDTSTTGKAAPHTDWISRTSLKEFMRDFSAIDMWLENSEEIFHRVPGVRRWLNRDRLIRSKFISKVGLDIYCIAQK